MIPKEQIAHDLAIAMMTAEFSKEKYHHVSFTQITKYKDYYKQFLSEL